MRASGRFCELMALRVAAGRELYQGLKPQQAARALNSLRDAGVIERIARGRWRVPDPLLQRYLIARQVEPLTFMQPTTDRR